MDFAGTTASPTLTFSRHEDGALRRTIVDGESIDLYRAELNFARGRASEAKYQMKDRPSFLSKAAVQLGRNPVELLVGVRYEGKYLASSD
jgi:hypothetical protein